MTLGSGFLVLAAVLFVIGLLGALLSRDRPIALIVSVHLIVLAAVLNFAGFAVVHDNVTGHVFAVLAFVVSLAHVVLLGGLLFGVLRNNESTSLDDIDNLRG